MTVIVVNWNGWRDTIPCLQSLAASTHPRLRVIVCDNGSRDDSVARIAAWNGGGRWSQGVRRRAPDTPDAVPGDDHVLLLETGANLGFSGGNNVGIRAALSDPDTAFVWLLNNDTTVAVDAVERLVAYATGLGSASLVSARIMSMDRPDEVWFDGGVYSPATASARHVSTERFASSANGFLTACAVMISRAALDRVGLLDDRIFLYGEDVDYSIRARRAGVPLAVAPGAVVLHKGGASSGIGSPFAYRHHVGNMVRTMLRYHGAWWLLTILPYHTAKLAYLVARRGARGAVAKAYLAGLADGARRRGESRDA